MVTTKIIQFHSEAPVEDGDLEKALKALRDNGAPGHFAIGSQIQDPHTVQVTAEFDDSEAGTQSSSIANTLSTSLGHPTNTTHIPFLSGSILQPNGPSTAKVIEYVQSFFPVSQLTDTFKQQIEADFNRFNTVLNSEGLHSGRGTLTYGWSEPASHPHISGEKASAFTVACGWDSMQQFEDSLKTETFRKAIPTLYAWGAPYRMWHIEGQVHGGGANGA